MFPGGGLSGTPHAVSSATSTVRAYPVGGCPYPRGGSLSTPPGPPSSSRSNTGQSTVLRASWVQRWTRMGWPEPKTSTTAQWSREYTSFAKPIARGYLRTRTDKVNVGTGPPAAPPLAPPAPGPPAGTPRDVTRHCRGYPHPPVPRRSRPP